MAKRQIQTDLFGNKEEMVLDVQSLGIVLPSNEDLESWTHELNYNCYLGALRLMAAPFLDMLRDRGMYIKDKDGRKKVPPLFKRMLAPGNKAKGQYASFMAYFMEPENFMLYFNTLTPQVQELWRTAIIKGQISLKEANAIAGEQVVDDLGGRALSEDAHPPKLHGWFERTFSFLYNYYSRSYDTYIRLNFRIVHHFMPAIFAGTLEQDKPLEQLPEDSGLSTFCGERHIFANLPTITALHASRLLEQNKNGRLSAASLKAAARQMAMAEFFPEDVDPKTCMLRAQLVLNVVSRVLFSIRKKLPAEEVFIKTALEAVTGDREFIVPVLLPEITGLRTTSYNNCDVGIILSCFFNAACYSDRKGWVAFDSLLLETMLNAGIADFNLFGEYEYSRINVVNKYSAKDVRYAEVRSQITFPLLRGYAFLLAAFGLVEIAYRHPEPGEASPYDGLQYVRVTELGRYCAGRTQTYTVPFSEDKLWFEVDDERLLVRSTEDDNPMLPILQTMATPITRRLYKVSYASFLSGCASGTDIDNRIRQFKRYVCPQPSAVWKQFFTEVRRRIHPFQTIAKTYTLVQIPADNKELQRILLTDPVIRKYTLKAEGYLFLIETKQQEKVRERLKTYGYLV